MDQVDEVLGWHRLDRRTTAAAVGWISDNTNVDHTLTLTWTQPQWLALIELLSLSALGAVHGLVFELLDPVTQQWNAAPVNGVERGRFVAGAVSGIGGRLAVHVIPTLCSGARVRRPAGAGYDHPPAGFEHVLAVRRNAAVERRRHQHVVRI